MSKIHVVIIFTPETVGTVGISAVGFSIQDDAMDVAQFAPQGAHYHADVIYLLP